MPVIRMPLLAAKEMAAALLPHISHDEWEARQPLGSATLGITESQFAFATDRYTLARYDLTNLASEWPTEPVFVPRDLLAVIGTLGNATMFEGLTQYEVVIEVGANPSIKADSAFRWEAALKVRHLREDQPPQVHFMRVFRAIDQTAKHLPFNRLLEEWVTGDEVNPRALLGADHLGKFTGYARRSRTPMRLTLPADPPPSVSKHSPVLIEIGPRFKGLLMPFTTVGRADFGPDLAADNRARIEASKPTVTEPTEEPNGE